MSHQFVFSPHILDNLQIPQTGFDVVQDISEPRLRMYITSRGIKTFFVRRRMNGRDMRVIIGRYPDIEISFARDKAMGILSAPAHKNVSGHKKIEFGRIVKQFIQQKVRRVSSSRDKLARALDRACGGLYSNSIDTISLSDLKAVCDKVSKESGVPTANRMCESLVGIFRFAQDMGYVAQNVAKDLPRLPEHRRVRPLNVGGIRRIITAAKKSKQRNIADAFLMLIYGFESKSKVFNMQWRDLDFNNYTWGNMPLSDAAVVLLQDISQNGQYVFPVSNGRKPISDPRATWAKLMTIAKTPGVRMDDVHKFMTRGLKWSSDREVLRRNMNKIMEGIIK